MAALITLGLAMIVIGACVSAFLKISFAIRREDRVRGSLRFDPANTSARAARDLVGIHGSRLDGAVRTW